MSAGNTTSSPYFVCHKLETRNDAKSLTNHSQPERRTHGARQLRAQRSNLFYISVIHSLTAAPNDFQDRPHPCPGKPGLPLSEGEGAARSQLLHSIIAFKTNFFIFYFFNLMAIAFL